MEGILDLQRELFEICFYVVFLRLGCYEAVCCSGCFLFEAGASSATSFSFDKPRSIVNSAAQLYGRVLHTSPVANVHKLIKSLTFCYKHESWETGTTAPVDNLLI